jgi:hypothetical protein
MSEDDDFFGDGNRATMTNLHMGEVYGDDDDVFGSAAALYEGKKEVKKDESKKNKTPEKTIDLEEEKKNLEKKKKKLKKDKKFDDMKTKAMKTLEGDDDDDDVDEEFEHAKKDGLLKYDVETMRKMMKKFKESDFF